MECEDCDFVTCFPFSLFLLLQKKKEGHGVNGSTPSAAASAAAAAGPLDPYAEDDEDQLRSIAKKFEEKYVITLFRN